MNPPIFQTCAAEPTITALLGTNPVRLFPFGEAPTDTVYPYAVWQIIGGSPENYLSGRPDIDSISLQVDIYAKTGSSAHAVAVALRDVIEMSAHITRWGGSSRDPVTRSYRVSFDVDWWINR